jgi:hypothetical protein
LINEWPSSFVNRKSECCGRKTPDANPSDPAYLKIRDLIYRISGIYHSEEKLYLLISRCARRMIALGVATPPVSGHLTTRGNRDAELRLLLNEITIGETYMFRHPAQLDALRNVILPQILTGQRFGGPQTAALLVRRLLDWRRAPHAGHVSARRKRQAAGRLDLRHSGHRFER